MLVTLSGRLIFVRPVQPSNALYPMLVTPPGRLMFFRLMQPSNAEYPMLVTLSDRLMLVSHVHPLNALQPMLVTPFPIVTLLIELLLEFHGMSEGLDQSFIFPLPLMVSVPALSRDHVTFAPLWPQLPDATTSAASALPHNPQIVRQRHKHSAKLKIQRFICLPPILFLSVWLLSVDLSDLKQPRHHFSLCFLLTFPAKLLFNSCLQS